jgi:hypothetical protein
VLVEQRSQRATVLLAQLLQQLVLGDGVLHQEGVNQHQTVLQQLEGERGNFLLLAPIGGENALAAIAEKVVRAIPALHNIEEESDSIFIKMRNHTWLILALNTDEQVQTWQYILVAYTQLEALALEILRLHQGVDEETFWKDPNKLKSLSPVTTKLGQHHLVSPETVQILKDVAHLRNSVAHKQLLSGMTTYVRYRNKPVFDDQYVLKASRDPDVHHSGINEETLELLLSDIERAQMELSRRRQTAARPGGAGTPQG